MADESDPPAQGGLVAGTFSALRRPGGGATPLYVIIVGAAAPCAVIHRDYTPCCALVLQLPCLGTSRAGSGRWVLAWWLLAEG
jgi:hypothetical protein